MNIPFFRRKGNLIGLDIGSSSIKISELKETGKAYRLINFEKIPLPHESIIEGTIMDAGIVIDAIKEGIRKLGSRNRNTAISVKGHSVIVKRIVLPSVTKAELEESIQWEAGQYIPFDVNEVNIDFQILGPAGDDQTKMETLLVAARKDIVTDYVGVVTEAGLIPKVVDLDSFAMENIFELNYPEYLDGVCALINIGASLMNINILRYGMPAFVRDSLIGGNQITLEIQRQMGLSFEEAESVKKGEKVIPGKESEIEKGIRRAASGIVAEIQRNIAVFNTNYPDSPIERIILFGGAAKTRGFIEVLEKNMGIPVELVDPFRKVEIVSRRFSKEEAIQIGSEIAISMGLSLRRADET